MKMLLAFAMVVALSTADTNINFTPRIVAIQNRGSRFKEMVYQRRMVGLRSKVPKPPKYDEITATPAVGSTDTPTDFTTDTPTSSTTDLTTDAPTAEPTASPTETPPCKYKSLKKCVREGCRWRPAKGKKSCTPCSESTKLKNCKMYGCVWQGEKGGKPAKCSSCTDQTKTKCVKKDWCVLVTKKDKRLCVSCATMAGKQGKCLRAKCAYDKEKKACEPCSYIKKEKDCDRMKSCSWKQRSDKKGKCEKIKGKVVLDCCDLGTKPCNIDCDSLYGWDSTVDPVTKNKLDK